MVFFLIALYFNMFCGGSIKIYIAHIPFNFALKVKVKSLSRVQLCAPKDCKPTMLLRPWDFPGKSTGMGCLFLLFHLPDPGIEPGSPVLWADTYHLSHQGNQFMH